MVIPNTATRYAGFAVTALESFCGTVLRYKFLRYGITLHYFENSGIAVIPERKATILDTAVILRLRSGMRYSVRLYRTLALRNAVR